MERKISHEEENYIISKIRTFLKIMGMENNVFKPDLVKRNHILVILSHVYSCKIRTLKQKDIRRLNKAEMKFSIQTVGYNLLDQIRN
jgi:hypothetical protein